MGGAHSNGPRGLGPPLSTPRLQYDSAPPPIKRVAYFSTPKLWAGLGTCCDQQTMVTVTWQGPEPTPRRAGVFHWNTSGS